MRYLDILNGSKLKECTSSASVASVANPSNSKDNIGVGFDADKDWGIYNFAKNKHKSKSKNKPKPKIIRR